MKEDILNRFEAGALHLHNRLVLPPMASAKASPEGLVTPQLLAYYREKSHGGHLSMVIVEHSFISPEGKASPNQLSVASDDAIEGLAALVKVLHGNGAKAVLQINHAGGATNHTITGCQTVAPWSITLSKKGEVGCVLETDEMGGIVRQFADAARRGQAAGFDGVEIHSAHGYLLNQFYSPLTNRRTDRYGGGVAGRTALHREVISAVREAVGNGYPVLLRLGACDDLDGGNTIDEAVQAAQLFEAAGIDILDISGGMSGYVLKGRENEQGYFSDVTEAVKQATALPVLLTGGITDIHAASALIREGKADLIGVGRAMLRDSNWAENALQSLRQA